MTSQRLVLGPLLRYVDEDSATIWLETDEPRDVTVRVSGGESWTAPTFTVHGHHYALVEVTGLVRGSTYEYEVDLDGERVWPPADSPFPPSRIRTLDLRRPLRLLYGSCRTSVPHDAEGNLTHGIDALRAYAFGLADETVEEWPDLVLFLGDQVYADETSDDMRAFIRGRRDIDEDPGEEIKDYEEYTYLYRLAWTDSANRWLLSTLPSAMIFDDHDIRDDWNTSAQWRRQMEATPWWHERIVGGLGSYWVYQHLGNLSPSELADDEMWKHVLSSRGTADPVDLGSVLDDFAERVDQHPDTYRWSYARDLGDVRLVVVDSRAARVLQPERRSIIDDDEMAWLDRQIQGGFDHLLIGTSLPFLLAPGLHHFEAWNEAVASGAWGRQAAKLGEKIRQGVDLEHWAAFQEGFAKVAGMVQEVADGRRGTAPGTITFLSGDVHHSYVSEVSDRPAGGARILQAVCSPIRNPLPRAIRMVAAASAYGVARPLGSLVSRSAKVPDPPFRWHTVKGPWFDNNIATLEVVERGLRLRWEAGALEGFDQSRPGLKVVADFVVNA